MWSLLSHVQHWALVDECTTHPHPFFFLWWTLPGSTWTCWCPSMWWGRWPVSSLNSLTWALNSCSTWEGKTHLEVRVIRKDPFQDNVCVYIHIYWQQSKWLLLWLMMLLFALLQTRCFSCLLPFCWYPSDVLVFLHQRFWKVDHGYIQYMTGS